MSFTTSAWRTLRQLNVPLAAREGQVLVVVDRVLPELMLFIGVLNLGREPGLPHRKTIVGRLGALSVTYCCLFAA